MGAAYIQTLAMLGSQGFPFVPWLQQKGVRSTLPMALCAMCLRFMRVICSRHAKGKLVEF